MARFVSEKEEAERIRERVLEAAAWRAIVKGSFETAWISFSHEYPASVHDIGMISISEAECRKHGIPQKIMISKIVKDTSIGFRVDAIITGEIRRTAVALRHVPASRLDKFLRKWLCCTEEKRKNYIPI